MVTAVQMLRSNPLKVNGTEKGNPKRVLGTEDAADELSTKGG